MRAHGSTSPAVVDLVTSDTSDDEMELMSEDEGGAIQDAPSPPAMQRYQEDTVEWAKRRELPDAPEFRGGIIVMPPGAGKTAVCLRLIQALRAAGKQTLVVCPKSVLASWREEVKKWWCDDDSLSVLFYPCKEVECQPPLSRFSGYDVIITNYDTVLSEYRRLDGARERYKKCESETKALEGGVCGSLSGPPAGQLRFMHKFMDNYTGREDRCAAAETELKQLLLRKRDIEREFLRNPFLCVRWERVVLDEAQRIKNGVKTTRALCELGKDIGWLVTATLINNDVCELYHYFTFLGVNHACSRQAWHRGVKRSEGARQALRDRMERVMFCVTKHETPVFNSRLPALNIYTYRHPFCSEGEMREYQQVEQSMVNNARESLQLKVQDKREEARQKEGFVFSGLSELRKVCSGLPLGSQSTKMMMFRSYVLARVLVGDKTLVFCQWVRVLKLAQDVFTELTQEPWCPDHLRRACSVVIEGKMNMEERMEAIRRFREEGDCVAMFVSTDAGSFGLNLQVANHVILLTPDFRPTSEEQAIGRAVRLGGRPSVDAVYLLISNTIEEAMFSLARIKATKNGCMQNERLFTEWSVTKEHLPSFSTARGVLDVYEAAMAERDSQRVLQALDVNLVIDCQSYSDWGDGTARSAAAVNSYTDPAYPRKVMVSQFTLGIGAPLGVYIVNPYPSVIPAYLFHRLLMSNFRVYMDSARLELPPTAECTRFGATAATSLSHPVFLNVVPAENTHALCSAISKTSWCRVSEFDVSHAVVSIRDGFLIDASQVASPEFVRSVRDAFQPLVNLIEHNADSGCVFSLEDNAVIAFLSKLIDSDDACVSRALCDALMTQITHGVDEQGGHMSYCVGLLLGEVRIDGHTRFLFTLDDTSPVNQLVPVRSTVSADAFNLDFF